MTRLEKFFRLYNEKYFDNTLPVAEVRWADMKYFGHYYHVDDFKASKLVARTHIIELGRWSSRNTSIWKMSLLHECVHLKLHNKKCKSHGRLFNNEMKRLANIGAFKDLW